jgi:hypothetical protein
MPEPTSPSGPAGRSPRGRITSVHLALALCAAIEAAGLIALVWKVTSH